MFLDNVAISNLLTNANCVKNASKLLRDGYEIRILLSDNEELGDKISDILLIKHGSPRDLWTITLSCNHAFQHMTVDTYGCKISYRKSKNALGVINKNLDDTSLSILLILALPYNELIRWRSPWKHISKELAEWDWK